MMAKSPDSTYIKRRSADSAILKIPDGARQAGRRAVPFSPGRFPRTAKPGRSRRREDEQSATFCFCGFWFSFAPGGRLGGAGGGCTAAAAAPVHPQRRDQKPSLAPDLSLLYKSRLIRAPSRKLPSLYSSSAPRARSSASVRHQPPAAPPAPCITPSSPRRPSEEADADTARTMHLEGARAGARMISIRATAT